ncbi:hypothetical protein KCU88_g37, partial [Aureobasidium melanogenum]
MPQPDHSKHKTIYSRKTSLPYPCQQEGLNHPSRKFGVRRPEIIKHGFLQTNLVGLPIRPVTVLEKETGLVVSVLPVPSRKSRLGGSGGDGDALAVALGGCCCGVGEMTKEAPSINLGPGMTLVPRVPVDILARSDGGRNGDNPRIVVGDHVVRSPVTRRGAAVNEASLVDLVEEQLGLVHCGAVVAARGQVVQHGSVVGFRPLRPLKFDRVSGRDLDICSAWSCSLVADDVGTGIVADEAAVLVFRD